MQNNAWLYFSAVSPSILMIVMLTCEQGHGKAALRKQTQFVLRLIPMKLQSFMASSCNQLMSAVGNKLPAGLCSSLTVISSPYSTLLNSETGLCSQARSVSAGVPPHNGGRRMIKQLLCTLQEPFGCASNHPPALVANGVCAGGSVMCTNQEQRIVLDRFYSHRRNCHAQHC